MEMSPPRVERRRLTLDDARRWTVYACAVELLVLVVTGVILYFEYRPGVDHWFRSAHRSASTLLVWTSLLGAALAVAPSARSRRVTAALFGIGLFTLVVAASVTGYLLPWDQVALRAVTVGKNLDGFGLLNDARVLFVLIDGAEVSAGTVQRWLYLHTLVLSPAAIVFAVLAWRHGRRTG